jgi:hypothetical protein
MMADLSKLSNSDLEAISAGRMQDVSQAGLKMLAGEVSAIDTALGLQPSGGRFQLLEAAKNKQQIATTDEDVARQVGLAARAGITGVLGLPTLASDALVSLVNMMGAKVPMPSQSQQQLLTRAGLPEPSTPQERTVQDITAAIGGVLGGYGLGAAMPPAMAAREILMSSPMFQLGAGTAAAGASALAREEGAGPLQQLGAGMLAGTIAPSAGAAGMAGMQAAGRGAREMVRPFTEQGREVIVGNILRQLAREPESAAAKMEAYVPGVSGYTPTAPQAARDVGLAGAIPTIRGIDETGRFAAQQIQANQARMSVLDKLAKDKDALTSAIAKRDEITSPLREQAFSKSTIDPDTFQLQIADDVGGVIQNILNSPVGKRGTVEKAMKFADDRISRASTPQELYEIRKDLRDAAQGLLDKEGSAFSLAKGQLEQVIRAIDNTIESAAPGYQDYLKKYAAASRGIERMEAAQEFRGKVLGTIPVITDPSNQAQYMISQPQFVRAIRAADKETNLSKTQLAVLRKVAKDLDDGSIVRLTAEPGSNTFKNISMANFMGQVIGKQMFGEVPASMQKGALSFNWLYGGPDDAIRTLLVDAMLDPKVAARMMRKATTAEMVPLSQELQRRALRLGYGQVFGLTEE